MENDIIKKLEELENTEKTAFSISRETGILLNSIIKTANFKNILELGTFCGYSAVWMAEALKSTDGHITTIEIDHSRVVLARELFEDVGLTKFITSIEGNVDEEIKKLDDKYDLVFIDGGNDYLEIFNLVDSKMLRKNGLIAIDNAISPERVAKDVDQIIDAMDKKGNYQKIKINLGGGLLLALKLN